MARSSMKGAAGAEFLSRFSERHNAAEILTYLDNAQYLKVLVVGETIIDEYQYCEALGKSSKEATLALRRLSTEKFAGGIIAVANHVASHAGEVGLVTMLGEVDPQEDFIAGKLSEKIKPRFVYQSGAPTIVKRRFIDSSSFHKVLEIYEIETALAPEENDKLCGALSETLPEYDVVIAADYGHGMLRKEAIRLLCSQARFLAVNTQSNAENHGFHTISRYPRADLVCLTEREVRLEMRDRQSSLRDLVMEVAARIGGSRIAVTRGRKGCLCYGRGEGFWEIPAFTTQVVDRIGAGDAFLSLAALCAAQQAPMEVVGFAGNAAGAHAVKTVGHRQPAERGLLFRRIAELLRARGDGAASEEVQPLKSQGRKVALLEPAPNYQA